MSKIIGEKVNQTRSGGASNLFRNGKEYTKEREPPAKMRGGGREGVIFCQKNSPGTGGAWLHLMRA